jgi:GH25 family lysozyme M1 (1,4-beta-N-acetylmuramidase)
MNGIDISNWQKGIDLDNVPFDFMICKATQGTTFVDRYCDTFVQKAIRLGKPWGVYHYVGGTGWEREASHFVNNIQGYIRHGILVIDWEPGQNRVWGDQHYLQKLVSKVMELTGVTPLIYASKSMFPWGVAKDLNCGTWVAQYANTNPTGYQDSPWNEAAYQCTIRQYSDRGRLSGYDGYLDLNKAYITPEQWARYADPKGATPTPHDDILTLASDVIHGMYGMGNARRERLGERYEAVQARVNELYQKAAAVKRGAYGNGTTRRDKLGSEYDIVQYIVNLTSR